MAETPKPLTVEPKDLAWLAEALKLSKTLTPDLAALLKSLPNIALEAWPAGGDVVVEGEKGEDFFVVYSGTLAVLHRPRVGEAQVMGTLKDGDFFGEIGFLMKSARSATVRAQTDCRLFRFSAGEFSGLLQRHRLLDDWIERVACERIEKLFF